MIVKGRGGEGKVPVMGKKTIQEGQRDSTQTYVLKKLLIIGNFALRLRSY